MTADVTLLSELPFWEWPPDGADIIQRALASSSDEERLAAVRLVHLIMDDALAECMLRLIVEDPCEEVRAAAATALGPAIEEADIYEVDADSACMLSRDAFEHVRRALKHLYHDASASDLVRRRVLETSVRSRMSWHTGAVNGAWRSESEDWRITAVFCMGFVPGFEDVIADALAAPTPALRFEAVRAAGMREMQEVAATVARMLSQPSESREVRLAAIEALPRIDPRTALDVLPPLTTSSDPELAALADDALREAAMWQSLGEEFEIDDGALFEADFADLDHFDDY